MLYFVEGVKEEDVKKPGPNHKEVDERIWESLD